MSLEQVFIAPWFLRKLRRRPLGVLLDGFCDWLLEQEFSRERVRQHVSNISHLNAWLAEQDRPDSNALARREIAGFLEAYPGRCRQRSSLAVHLKWVRHSLNRFLAFLTQEGLFDPTEPVPVYQPLLEAYLSWMRDHQHAAEGTLELRRHSVERFLCWLGGQATAEGLSGLTAARVEAFFIDYAQDAGPAARRAMQAALRTFLRFSLHEGYLRHPLDQAVPPWRVYKLARVPRGLSEAQAQAVLQSVDRNTAVGRRDYAILQLLHTYGVRGGQVRALRLNEIRWLEDQILFRAAKGGKDSLLPLTVEVGESLLDYLQNARPRSSSPEVFLTCRAPYHPLPRSSALSGIVDRRIGAAGVDVASRGAHAFRHALATRMVAEGHSLKAVADVLGHRHLSTTFLYTKIDFKGLSEVALEWPEEVI